MIQISNFINFFILENFCLKWNFLSFLLESPGNLFWGDEIKFFWGILGGGRDGEWGILMFKQKTIQNKKKKKMYKNSS